MTFAVWVELEVQDGKLPEFMAAITENQAATLAEPGCEYFDVLKLDREGQWFGFYELYRDEDAFYKEHRSYPHFLKWREAVAQTVVPNSQTITPAKMQIATS